METPGRARCRIAGIPALGRRVGWAAVAGAVALVFAPAQLAVGAPWKFLVTGDSRGYSMDFPVSTTILSELARAFTNEQPAFVVFAGDATVWGSATNYWVWTNALSPVYEAGIPVYGALGNHDLGDVAGFADVFGAAAPDNGPEGEKGLTYAIGWSNALVLVLDALVSTNYERVNQDWVDAVLATNTAPHVFAVSHLPAFKVFHADGLDDYPMERDRFWNSLSNAHARVFFAGHDHFYNHSRLDDGDGNADNDVHQLVVGTAGAPLYPDGPYDGMNGIWTPVRVFHEGQFGYVRVEIEADKAWTTWVHRNADGVYEPGGDTFTWSVLPRPILKVERKPEGVVLSWEGDAELEAGPSAIACFTTVPMAASPFVVPNGGEGSVFFRLRR